VTPCLTCYGKQRRHFEFTVIWRTRAVILNLTCYLYNAAMLQYGCYSGNFKLMLNLNIYYLYNAAILNMAAIAVILKLVIIIGLM